MGFSSSRIFAAGRGLLVTAAMVGCLGFAGAAVADEAAEVKWPDPQQVLSTKTYADDGTVATQQILAAAKGTYNVLPLWLGIADTVCDSPAGMNMGDGETEITADTFRTSGLFGTYASPANSEPDVYMSNLFYSYVNPDAGLSAANRDEVALICSGQPTAADTTVTIGGTSNSLYYRPELIVGGNQAGDAATGAAAYSELVAAINDGSIGAENYVEGDETYDPYLMDGWNAYEGNSGYQGSVRGTTGMLYDMAQVTEEIKAEDETKVTRYGNDAYAIAETFEELFLGAQAAILEQIENGTVEQKVIAVVSSVDKDTQTAEIAWSDASVQLGNVNMQAHAPQYALQDVTVNLAYVLSGGAEPTDTAEGPAEDESEQQGQGGQGGNGGSGSTGGQGQVNSAPGGTITISLAELAQADVIICTGQNTTGTSQSDVEEAFAAAGITDIPTGIYVNPTNVGTGNFDADKCVFTLNWLGAVYPEVFSSTDLLAYFYSEIAHVDDEYLANVLALNCASMTLVGDDTLDHDSAYYLDRVAAVQGVVDEGMDYLVANLDQIVAEHTNLEPVKDAEGNYRNRNL